MKIAFINSFYNPKNLGGAELVVQNLAEGLSCLGHQVKVFTLDEKDESSVVNNVSVSRFKSTLDASPYGINPNIGLLKKIIWHKNKIYNPSISNIVSKNVEAFNPDVINIHNIAGISTLIFKRLKKRMPNAVIVSTLHDYWPICYRNTLLDRNNRIVIRLNLINKLRTIFISRLLKYVDAFVSPSVFLAKKIQHFTNIDPSLFNVISNGMYSDTKSIRFNENKVINFLFLGQLVSHKGVITLINAINNVKSHNCIFNIAGKGPLSYHIEENKKINYLGFVNGENKKQVLEDNDVLIIPSEWYENNPLVILEAFQNGMAVIGSDIGGISELVHDGKDGFLYKMGSVVDLTEKIEFICNNIDVLNSLKRQAFDKGKKYSLNNMINNYNSLFLKVCGTNNYAK